MDTSKDSFNSFLARPETSEIVKSTGKNRTLDIYMPELNGIEATREIKRLVPQTEVLILTGSTTEQLYFLGNVWHATNNWRVVQLSWASKRSSRSIVTLFLQLLVYPFSRSTSATHATPAGCSTCLVHRAFPS